MLADPFRPIDGLRGQFSDGRGPFSVRGAGRTVSLPVPRVHLCQSSSDGAGELAECAVRWASLHAGGLVGQLGQVGAATPTAT